VNSYERIYNLLIESDEQPAHWAPPTIRSRIRNLLRAARDKMRKKRTLKPTPGREKLGRLAQAEVDAGR